MLQFCPETPETSKSVSARSKVPKGQLVFRLLLKPTGPLGSLWGRQRTMRIVVLTSTISIFMYVNLYIYVYTYISIYMYINIYSTDNVTTLTLLRSRKGVIEAVILILVFVAFLEMLQLTSCCNGAILVKNHWTEVTLHLGRRP